MKIVHLCLGAFFPDNYSYQENMLPKFHKQLGYDVEVIASQESFDENGERCFLEKSGYYLNEYGIQVCRVKYSWPKKLNHKFKHYIGVYSAIEKAKPDLIFIHNCQFTSIFEVIKYIKKNPKVKVYVDSHVDFSNSATNWLSKNVLHKILWRYCANKVEPYVTKFYGVLPARVDFLKNIYKLPAEKCELLVMGADDDKVEEARDPKIRAEIRKKYNISEDDFLIMTGGKIDPAKAQTLMLMQAVAKIEDPHVKLIVFGSVTPELKEKVCSLEVVNKVIYIGWIDAREAYKYFASSELVVFPGRHSVFWEQVVGLGIPMICKYWEGTTHVDLGENVVFLHEDSVETLYNTLQGIIESPDKYQRMRLCAEKNGMTTFSYKKIAERCIR